MKKSIALLMIFILITSILTGCMGPTGPEHVTADPAGYGKLSGDVMLTAAVVYHDGTGYQQTTEALRQSKLLGLSVTAEKLTDSFDPGNYDVLYLDKSLTPSEAFVTTLSAYVEAGGALFVDNALIPQLPEGLLGITDTASISGCPETLTFEKVTGDAASLQQIIRDFAQLYPSFMEYNELKEKDYGFGFRADTALALAGFMGRDIYALHSYGKGHVFTVNPLLPNAYSAASYDMEVTEGQTSFSSTTQSFNSLILSGFAEYVAQQKYGFALERVYGYFGTPSMAWELHYEELTGFENDALQKFSVLAEKANQIPSFTLIRSSYTWFMRAETVTTLLNGADDGYAFAMDLNENNYSSGTHIDAGGQWLSQVQVEDGGSYFADYMNFTHRAIPAVLDYDGDGDADLFVGSQDGQVYYYEGLGYSEGRLHVKEAVPITDAAGTVLKAGYSAPEFYDLNGDTHPDLILGSVDGKIRWYRGDGSLSFAPMDTLIDTGIQSQALPAVGDLNGDGIPDLAVGSGKGNLKVYWGVNHPGGSVTFDSDNPLDLSPLCGENDLGLWLSPAVEDIDLDGDGDLCIGTFQGYVARILNDGKESFSFGGYLDAEEMNYKGNSHHKFGNWASPAFYDLNGDGAKDLICGSQEYGMAIPIDSEYFPLRDKLQAQVDYAKEHHYNMGLHFYTNAYASDAREDYELAAHLKALESYGIDTGLIGANQHTWYTSSLSGSQSMKNLYEAGLKWQSGFSAPGAPKNIPQVSAENALALPFYLMDGDAETLLVQNNSVLPYKNDDWYQISARYGMPVCIYYHCDFVYENEDPYIRDIQKVQDFRVTYGYNFNREDQLMLASAAALNQSVSVTGNLSDGLTLTGSVAPDHPLYDEAVSASLGVKVVFSADMDAAAFIPDADIWKLEGNSLILGLNRTVSLLPGEITRARHLTRINMAADITCTEHELLVEFLSHGMMQAAVKGHAVTDSPGWTLEYVNGETVFTKFGAADTLHIRY